MTSASWFTVRWPRKAWREEELEKIIPIRVTEIQRRRTSHVSGAVPGMLLSGGEGLSLGLGEQVGLRRRKDVPC